LIGGEDVGGALSRTMYLEVDSGRVAVRANGQIREL
jgi:chemotaxis receptor (MCP) glutamine deamidase CheD